MPHLNRYSSRFVLGVFCVFGLCGQALAAASPTTLEEIKQMLQHQQQIIERQQAQIEALQQAASKQDEVGTTNAAVQTKTDSPEQQPDTRLVSQETTSPAPAPVPNNGLNFEGYAVANYQRYDFYENVQDATPEHRARTDLERFVLEIEYAYNDIFSFEAEIEIEHGGTGSAVEFEREETGEFESEVESGGEVTIEKAFLQASIIPEFNLRFGEIVVPFGMINTNHRPTEYFTQERSLAETALIPSVWHETGVSVFGIFRNLRYEAQIISALDSSGFSGPGFVSGGTQGRLEFDNAGDLAFVLRADYAFGWGADIGAAFYTGGSAGNRPRRNLAEDAQVTLYEAHLRFERGPWKLRGQYTFGQIDDSDAVSLANRNFFNGGALGVSRTPVGHQAESWFIAGGYDLFTFLDFSRFGQLDVFGRYETYDTHAATEGNIQRIARYDRTARTVGLNYIPQPGIVFKAEYSYRTDAGNIGDEADVYGLGLGFEF